MPIGQADARTGSQLPRFVTDGRLADVARPGQHLNQFILNK